MEEIKSRTLPLSLCWDTNVLDRTRIQILTTSWCLFGSRGPVTVSQPILSHGVILWVQWKKRQSFILPLHGRKKCHKDRITGSICMKRE